MHNLFGRLYTYYGKTNTIFCYKVKKRGESEIVLCVIEIFGMSVDFQFICCLIRSASNIARSCLLCMLCCQYCHIWDPVILLLWFRLWCFFFFFFFLLAACCLKLYLIVVRVCPLYVDWKVVHSPWFHVYWYTTLNGWSSRFGLFLMNRFLTFRHL